MGLEGIQRIISNILEVTVIILTVFHLRLEIRKSKNAPQTARPFHSTFRVTILTLILVVSGTFIILQYQNPKILELVVNNWTIIWSGIKCTFFVSIISIVCGSIIGVFLALIITKGNGNVFMTLIDSTIMSVVYILMGIPALVLLFLVYFSGGSSMSAFTAAAIALSINLSPFVAKIVAASIKNISVEQIDSAIAFGYSPRQITRYFKIGYVMRNSIQSLLVEYYTTIKLSSFAGLISLVEIYHVSQDIIKDTQDPVSSYIILTICYVIIVTPLAVCADYLENKWRVK